MNLAEACVATWIMSIVLVIAVTFQASALLAVKRSAERQQALYLCQGDMEQIGRALSQGGALSVPDVQTVGDERFPVSYKVQSVGSGLAVISVTLGYGRPVLAQSVTLWTWQAVKTGD